MDMLMNEFDFTGWVNLVVPLFSVISVFIIGLLAVYTWTRIRITETNIEVLEEQLKVFSEASIGVACAVEKAVQMRPEPSLSEGRTSIAGIEMPLQSEAQRVSSRRYLLKEAMLDLSSGHQMNRVKDRFALQQDEVFLLSRMSGSDS